MSDLNEELVDHMRRWEAAGRQPHPHLHFRRTADGNVWWLLDVLYDCRPARICTRDAALLMAGWFADQIGGKYDWGAVLERRGAVEKVEAENGKAEG